MPKETYLARLMDQHTVLEVSGHRDRGLDKDHHGTVNGNCNKHFKHITLKSLRTTDQQRRCPARRATGGGRPPLPTALTRFY